MFRLDIWLYRYAPTSQDLEGFPPPCRGGLVYLQQFSGVL